MTKKELLDHPAFVAAGEDTHIDIIINRHICNLTDVNYDKIVNDTVMDEHRNVYRSIHESLKLIAQ